MFTRYEIPITKKCTILDRSKEISHKALHHKCPLFPLLSQLLLQRLRFVQKRKNYAVMVLQTLYNNERVIS